MLLDEESEVRTVIAVRVVSLCGLCPGWVRPSLSGAAAARSGGPPSRRSQRPAAASRWLHAPCCPPANGRGHGSRPTKLVCPPSWARPALGHTAPLLNLCVGLLSSLARRGRAAAGQTPCYTRCACDAGLLRSSRDPTRPNTEPGRRDVRGSWCLSRLCELGRCSNVRMCLHMCMHFR